ncbi:MAG TPA: phosphonate C-P lyase system protein PhnG [Ruminiclostridium sp.]
MNKKQLFQIMNRSDCNLLKNISDVLSSKYSIVVIKEPSKTLAMIKMREPVKSSLFYIGEVMVSEALVELDGTKGIAVAMGDNFDKVLYMAIIDAGFNSQVLEMETIRTELLNLEYKQTEKLRKENSLHLKTMVNFSSMDNGVSK